MSLEFVLAPINRPDLDWSLAATCAPAHITIWRASVDRVLDFFQAGRAASPAMVQDTAAALQVRASIFLFPTMTFLFHVRDEFEKENNISALMTRLSRCWCFGCGRLASSSTFKKWRLRGPRSAKLSKSARGLAFEGALARSRNLEVDYDYANLKVAVGIQLSAGPS